MSRVRVCLLADALHDVPPRGLARYTRGLCTALLESGTIDLELITHDPAGVRAAGTVLRGARLTARREVAREQIELPRLLARRGAAVLHAPANRGLPLWAPCPTVVTRHDVIERMFPAEPASSWRARCRTLYADEIAMRRATIVATVSQTSRGDIVRRWPGLASRLVVAGQGIEARFFAGVATAEREQLRRRRDLPPRFVLYVGGFEPRKDVATLIAAVGACRVTGIGLVLVGATGPWRGPIERAVAGARLQDRVRLLEFVGDDELPALYAAAAVVVCPSRYEGFGLPVVEAMACGTPVIVSRGGALPEIAGEAAAVFPVGDAGALARTLERVLTEQTWAEALVERGLRRAEDHRWERVVARYVSIYHQVGRSGALPPAAQPVPA
ncbi:MAG TPA: glycosyltransferase family 1 protein [Methylomirabilota bacterium]|jgi:glycosyltransferase involved in cell wall biosynthesis|nr:glycosyltransferase family 1 protein [Methylomirabilota bacterium]